MVSVNSVDCMTIVIRVDTNPARRAEQWRNVSSGNYDRAICTSCFGKFVCVPNLGERWSAPGDNLPCKHRGCDTESE